MNTGLPGLILKRLLSGLVTLFIVSVMVFAGTELLPGDVAEAILGQQATPEAVEAIRRELELHRPAPVRYLDWLSGCLQGDLGRSLANGREVAELVSGRLGRSLTLAAVAALIAIPLAVGLGLVAALYEDRLTDKGISATTLAFVSMPEFLVGYMLLYVFAVKLGWLPALSRLSDAMPLSDQLRALALPCATLALVVSAHTMRLTRAAVLSVMSQPYIEMAELKGATRRRIIVLHALPNVLSTILNIVLLTLAYLVVGVVVVEAVFNYSGMGKLMVDAVSKRDVPLVQACGLIFASVYVTLNVGADVLAILANPRRRRPAP